MALPWQQAVGRRNSAWRLVRILSCVTTSPPRSEISSLRGQLRLLVSRKAPPPPSRLFSPLRPPARSLSLRLSSLPLLFLQIKFHSSSLSSVQPSSLFFLTSPDIPPSHPPFFLSSYVLLASIPPSFSSGPLSFSAAASGLLSSRLTPG